MSAAGRNQPESAAPASERDESRPRHTPPAGASSSKPVYLVGAAAQAKPGVAPQAVQLPVPVAVARIRSGTTVTLAPRASVPGTHVGLPALPASHPALHVPKGPAAVASIAVPRSTGAAAAASGVVRPASSVSIGVGAASQAVGFGGVNRPASRPALSSEGAASRPAANAWVSVTSAPPQVGGVPTPVVYKAAGAGAAAAPALKSGTGNVILSGKTTAVAGAATAAAATTTAAAAAAPGVVKGTPVSNVSSSITLLSVRGPATGAAVRAPSSNSLPSAGVVRPTAELVKTNATLLQPVMPQRAPSMTITSTSSVQGIEKHYVKTVPAASPAAKASAPIHIAGRPLAPAVSSGVAAPPAIPGPARIDAVVTNSAVTPVVFTGGLKSMTPVTKGIAVQLPQMSVTAVASKGPALGGASGSHAPPAATSTLVPVGLARGVATPATGRTYLLTTAQASPSLSAPPPVKVLAPSTGPGAAAKGSDAGATSTPAEGPTSTSLAPAASSYLHPTPSAVPRTAVGADSAGASGAAKMGTSPRPSILRKRDYEGAPLKAQKNLSAALALMTSSTPTTTTTTTPTSVPVVSSASPPSPRRLDLATPGGVAAAGESSRSSSGGSTTLSASSSPGIPADMDESQPPINLTTLSASAILGKALTGFQIKQEALEGAETSGAATSLMRTGTASAVPPATLAAAAAPAAEMSPRKKPRKQQLLGQELQEVRSSDEDMHHPAAVKEPKPEVSVKCEPKEVLAVVKRPRVSLMSSYRQTWKARHHHFVRYSDVKLKDERRPTVSDLANQKHVMQKIHGWKIYHLSAQIDEMAFSESQVHDRLNAILEAMEKLGGGKTTDREMVRVNELIKGNLQRSKVIQDGLIDSKIQVQKLFEHKPRAEDIIHRYMYKRLSKKREKT